MSLLKAWLSVVSTICVIAALVGVVVLTAILLPENARVWVLISIFALGFSFIGALLVEDDEP